MTCLYAQIAINLTVDEASTSSWTLITMTGDKAIDALDVIAATVIYNDGAKTNWELELSEEEHSLILAPKA